MAWDKDGKHYTKGPTVTDPVSPLGVCARCLGVCLYSLPPGSLCLACAWVERREQDMDPDGDHLRPSNGEGVPK